MASKGIPGMAARSARGAGSSGLSNPSPAARRHREQTISVQLGGGSRQTTKSANTTSTPAPMAGSNFLRRPCNTISSIAAPLCLKCRTGVLGREASALDIAGLSIRSNRLGASAQALRADDHDLFQLADTRDPQ